MVPWRLEGTAPTRDLTNCVGPLLYHFEGHGREPSIELSIEEIREAIGRLGLTMEREAIGSEPLAYAQDRHSLHQTGYRCWFFIVRKPLHRIEQ